jgi:hypothetical protein
MANNLFFWEESSDEHRFATSTACKYQLSRYIESGQWNQPARVKTGNGLLFYESIEPGETVTLTIEGVFSLGGELANRMRGVVAGVLPKGFRFATFGDYLEDDIVKRVAIQKMIDRASWYKNDQWQFTAGLESDCIVFMPLSISTYLPEIIVHNPRDEVVDISALWRVWRPTVVDYQLGLELLSVGHELQQPIMRCLSGNPKNSDSGYTCSMLDLLCEELYGYYGMDNESVSARLGYYFEDMDVGYSIRAFYASTFGTRQTWVTMRERVGILNEQIRYEERGRGLDEGFEAMPQFVAETPEVIDEVVSDTPTVEIGDADSESDKENEKSMN